MKRSIFIFFVLLLLPRFARAEVRITEIAWMGTQSSQYSEWLELYNGGAEAVDLAGWKLYGGDSLIYTFTKTIEAGEYLLLERTTASAPDAVPGIDDESGSFGGGGLSNAGEDMVLKDADGTTVESLPFGSGWPAGDASTKLTMQWDGDAWVTADPTPKTATSVNRDAPSVRSNGATSKEIDPYPIPPVSPNRPHIEFVTPENVYAGIPYEYKAHPVFEYNFAIDKGSYLWNMGDGAVLSQDSFAPLSHSYRYPGVYTISFLYSDPTNTNNTLSGTKTVTVVSPSLALAIVDHRALEIKNTSATPVNLSGWSLLTPGKRMRIPDMTIVAERAAITIPFFAFALEEGTSSLSLEDPSGAVVASVGERLAPTLVGATPLRTLASTAEIPAASEVVTSAAPTDGDASDQQLPRKQNRTKTIVFGAVSFFVIVLSILLERFMARQEYL